MEWQRRLLPVHGTVSPSAVLKKDEGTVVMTFPKRVILLVDNTNIRVLFEAGIHNVPAHLADHWYLKANGAQRHEVPAQSASEPAEEQEFDDAAEDASEQAPRRPGRPRKV